MLPWHPAPPIHLPPLLRGRAKALTYRPKSGRSPPPPSDYAHPQPPHLPSACSRPIPCGSPVGIDRSSTVQSFSAGRHCRAPPAFLNGLRPPIPSSEVIQTRSQGEGGTKNFTQNKK
ncbi:hypothetical protein GQ55_9G432600 [Panicum hallii var. hallii]|uniref:Uncharacterized protein n=1 Tax=Panicum hallii var. hallii TaxID=1504633 RepID=A0A2T7CB32_9POAL|nr:hypothetical protein GQ55_9G432600 [Panicum hallii var. hallii]